MKERHTHYPDSGPNKQLWEKFMARNAAEAEKGDHYGMTQHQIIGARMFFRFCVEQDALKEDDGE